MAINSYIYHKLAQLIPETRMYGIKSLLLSYCGYTVQPSARIASSAKFIGSFNFTIGHDSFIGHEVLVTGGECSIAIGDDCDLGPRVCLIAGSHEIDMAGAHTAGKGCSKDIIIEDGVWIGANVTVLGGVRIGAKSVVGAGSTVLQDIPPNVIAAGTPCKVKKIWNPDTQRWDLLKS